MATSTLPELNDGVIEQRASAEISAVSMTVNSFAAALEAKRCIEALDRIESVILARAKNELAGIALERPDIAGVTESIAGGLTDAVGDSGLRAMKLQLCDAIEKWERKAS